MKGEKIYGVADLAWNPLVGCDPHMRCAPRCWARRTVARIVECQKTEHPERSEFFQIALTQDGQKWSGRVFLDSRHLNDPRHWRKPLVISVGFHGDWGRLSTTDQLDMLSVMEACKQHRFLPLTKQPQDLLAALIESYPVLPHVNVGCSVMDQQDADAMLPAMSRIAKRGWNTHVWHEPAIGPVNWSGWEFLRGMITGFESGAKSRPGHPDWARDDRDWCVLHGISYNFKQNGDWEVSTSPTGGSIQPGELWISKTGKTSYPSSNDVDGNSIYCMRRVGKKVAGRLLDGRTWDGVPEFGPFKALSLSA